MTHLLKIVSFWILYLDKQHIEAHLNYKVRK